MHDWEYSSRPEVPEDPTERMGYNVASAIALILTVIFILIVVL